jgi:glutamate synthase (NADPH/NADH) small chain
MKIEDLEEKFDAILICSGSSIKRDLDIPGNKLSGIVQAMDFLTHNNKYVDGQIDKHNDKFNAKNKNVIVIGGGDTGSDCIGTSNRHGSKSVTNFELAEKPSTERLSKNPWPHWPFTLKSSSSHKEGVERKWSILTKEFIGDENNNIKSLVTVNVEFNEEKNQFIEIPNSKKIWDCDLVILALGFTGPEKKLPKELDVMLDKKGNISANSNYQTKKNNIFTAGDCRRGQSLIVWAISEGREASYHLDKYLMGSSSLPRKNTFGDL